MSRLFTSGPRWLHLARKELGTKEQPGPRNNPDVQMYYCEAVNAKHPDSVPWCAAFVGAMLARAGKKPSRSLMARSYLNWGVSIREPIPGAIVVFSRGRPPAGHVAFVESVHDSTLIVIGGNQSDAVTRAVYPKSKVLGYRWPKGSGK